jgi:membrane peptidoglycan carboxypeptidase
MDEKQTGRGGVPPEDDSPAGDSTWGDSTSSPQPRRARSTGGERWRRAGIGAGIAALVLLLVFGVMWKRCGLSGCPDVDMLRGYMPEEASVVLDRNGEEITKLFVTRRTVVSIDSMPEHTLNAFVAI